MDETFNFHGHPYLYEPEHTDKEIFKTEETTRRERERENRQRRANQLLLKVSEFPQWTNVFVVKRKLFNESIYVDIIITDGVHGLKKGNKSKFIFYNQS